tara:strand:+ start:436 stop:768 length:333 start_codon:yes stop_codon:yes gene_type:complete
MAETFKRFGGAVNSSDTTYDVATTNTGDIAVVLACTLTNISGSDITANVRIVNSGNSTQSYLIYDATLAAGTALEVVQNKIVLEAGEKIVCYTNSNQNLYATIAALQITS